MNIILKNIQLKFSIKDFSFLNIKIINKIAQNSICAILPLTIILIWYVLTANETIRSNLLPPPQEVVNELLILANDGELLSHILITLNRVFNGFILGGFVASILGIITGISPTFRNLFDPTIQALKAVPSLAWVPLFILWFGIFENSKVALISVGVFFPIYLNLMMGIRQIDKKIIEVAHINNLNHFQTIRWVLIQELFLNGLQDLEVGLL